MSVWETIRPQDFGPHTNAIPTAGVVVGPYNVATQTPGQPANIDFPVSSAGALVPLPWLLLINSSPYALTVAQGIVLKILPAFTADVFRVMILPNGDNPTWTPFVPIAGTPQAGQDTTLYATWYGDRPDGIYPCAVAAAVAFSSPPPQGSGIIFCTSTTRPTSPTQGTTIYELDTGRMLTWQSATTGWTNPWNTAWGLVAWATITSNSGTASQTALVVPGLSFNYTAVANRRLRLQAHCLLQGNTTSTSLEASLRQDAISQVIARANLVGASGATGSASVEPSWTFTTDTALHVYAVYIQSQPSGTVFVVAGTTFISSLVLEDLGPAGAPA